MRVGVTLPQFREEAGPALAAAGQAEALGIEGVFCFDHLWPMGQPGRPAISMGPMLGAVAASTSSVHLGPLVARIGLLPDQVLTDLLCGVHAMSGGRLIAGIGTGDRLSSDENRAYGIPFESAADRRSRLASVATAVRAAGVPVWVGGAHPDSVALARSIGAAVNVWEQSPGVVADLVSQGVEVTWGGPIGDTVSDAAKTMRELADAGASWAVCAWPGSLDVVAEAATGVR